MPCITLFGDRLPSLLVTKCLTLDANILATGLRQNEDFEMVHWPKVRINTLTINVLAQDIVVSHFESLKPTKLEEQKETILLLDDLRTCTIEGLLLILNQTRIKPVFIPLHSFQVLLAEDLLTFAIYKQELTKYINLNDLGSQTQRISNLVAAIEVPTTPSRNRSASRSAGISYKVVNSRFEAIIEEVQLNLKVHEFFAGEALQN
ncbi:MAG: hypothetical protein EZS28_037204 [Streblomastix strix]|uniref:DDE-1 domain-containing protein n=1 Tax=Streblomastix strix TaxID=222440 RepID=A0A5J4UA03_9EUKA|nr:MAG: hypothetical protein EZS28_037204 [Streblomastix strix]